MAPKRCPFCRKPVEIGISVSLPTDGAGGVLPLEQGHGRLDVKAHGHCYARWFEEAYASASDPAWVAKGTD